MSKYKKLFKKITTIFPCSRFQARATATYYLVLFSDIYLCFIAEMCNAQLISRKERNKENKIIFAVALDLHNVSREMSDLRAIAESTSHANKLRDRSRNLSRDVTRINRPRHPLLTWMSLNLRTSKKKKRKNASININFAMADLFYALLPAFAIIRVIE